MAETALRLCFEAIWITWTNYAFDHLLNHSFFKPLCLHWTLGTVPEIPKLEGHPTPTCCMGTRLKPQMSKGQKRSLNCKATLFSTAIPEKQFTRKPHWTKVCCLNKPQLVCFVSMTLTQLDPLIAKYPTKCSWMLMTYHETHQTKTPIWFYYSPPLLNPWVCHFEI